MSVTTPNAPAASEWTLEGELQGSSFMDDFRGLLGASADTPPPASDQPSSDTGQEKPAATAVEPKAETPATEDDTSDAEGDGEKVYSKEAFERSRQKANQQRDLAVKEKESLAAELAQHQKSLSENEFQRGTQLRQLQLMEDLALQKGPLDIADIRACQIQAFQEMQAARDQIVQADLTKAQQDAQQQQWSAQDSKAAIAEAKAMFADKAYTLQLEAGAAGVPTFDAKTSLQDILFSEAYQDEITDLNSLPRDKQEKAANRLYERAMRDVRAKMQLLVDAKQPPTPAPQPIPDPQDIPRAPTVQGYNISDAFERTFGDAGNYEAIIHANPHLRGR